MPGVTTAFQTGVHASLPAANAGCIHYSCTTHSLIYQSDGTTWTTWASLIGTGLTDPMTTRGDVISRNASNVTARLAKGSADTYLGSDGTDVSYSAVTDAKLSTSDITTNNASTSKHGFLKKLDNTATHFMDGTGAWSTPSATATALTVAGPTNVGANASIGNGSYTDIVSQAITAGTWLVLYDLQISGTSGRVITYHIVNDAGTEQKVHNTTIGSTGQQETSGFCVMTVAGSDHAKLQAESSGAGDVARGTTAWTNPATQIYAIKVA